MADLGSAHQEPGDCLTVKAGNGQVFYFHEGNSEIDRGLKDPDTYERSNIVIDLS